MDEVLEVRRGLDCSRHVGIVPRFSVQARLVPFEKRVRPVESLDIGADNPGPTTTPQSLA